MKRTKLDGTRSRRLLTTTETEAAFLRYRSKAVGYTVNEYIRRLILADKKKSGF